jgi:hypothetical protein
MLRSDFNVRDVERYLKELGITDSFSKKSKEIVVDIHELIYKRYCHCADKIFCTGEYIALVYNREEAQDTTNINRSEISVDYHGNIRCTRIYGKDSYSKDCSLFRDVDKFFYRFSTWSFSDSKGA